jgi:hypothetical protein
MTQRSRRLTRVVGAFPDGKSCLNLAVLKNDKINTALTA